MTESLVATLNSIFGYLKMISGTSAIIHSDQGKTYTLAITRETGLNSCEKLCRSKPREPDRVLVDVHETGGDLLAVEIDFDPPESPKFRL